MKILEITMDILKIPGKLHIILFKNCEILNEI
jgi:hypothetical protein